MEVRITMIQQSRRRSMLAVTTLAGLAILGGTGIVAAQSDASFPPPTCVDGSIKVGGSTAMQPLVDEAAQEYMAVCPNAIIDVQGGGSGTGLTQVAAGAFQIGDSDVKAEDKLKPEDASKLVDHPVVKQGWIMVASPDVTGVTSLTSQQATDIWTGTVTNWKDVGGPDLPIVLILRPDSSGTRATFKKIVLGGAAEASGQALTEDSNGAVTQAIAATPGSTSVIGFAYYQENKDQLVGLALDGVDATVDNMANGSYKLSAEGHMYTNGEPDGLTAGFIDYMLSPEIQTVLIPSLYYAPIAAAPAASPAASPAG
jgi:phosphate transport system substrate-binding protein